ncbi:F0F1 ATP synthase subunit epsilon [Fructilactobacillus sanfranciscensis]|uniref:F0F1 ATP synthase subunit epsilon n=1 Tax=Fructilactobacillus sanfranciscensis TaxID=1625 RepID=UPI0013D848BC|nr:F0F1 ATP synthase subunit epsilon [Fructilactobacillus sanfranciscensis]MDN4461666.1 F0F1 ATP synthase subunit epsilon [Fructilactobacillus sanfranciscensis]NDR61048.1 F0F1 ATP synthase subunit epsilon [Fructilactobacillus sanfranciscensis]
MADNSSVLTVSIVTPDGEVYSNDKCSLAVVQTQSGELGIMANHIPVIASLKIGSAQIKSAENSDILAVNGGFVEFSNNELTIVADSAELKGDIDVARAESAKKRAQAHLKEANETHDTDSMKRAEVALRRAINRIDISEH